MSAQLSESDVAKGATAENPHAGQGSVLLDIGGDVGALIVAMPDSLVATEVELREAGDRGASHHDGHAHRHGHDHGHEDAHAHSHSDGHSHEQGHDHGRYPHVAVVDRPAPDGASLPSLVFPELVEGAYELYVKGTDEVRMTVEVRGGEVTEAVWPS